MDNDDLAPTLQNIIDQKSLRWVFVGGKGGVGKTTTSCSLAVQLAKSGKNVLIISTDPAHNLSDAFGQQFGKDARKVDGVENLSAMEIDPSGSISDLVDASAASGAGAAGAGANVMQDIANSIPGVDEAMSFAEVMKQVKSTDFDVIVFDTAPTGHTLRFLQFPTVLEKALAKISELSGRFGPMLNGLVGGNSNSNEDIFGKLDNMRETISEVNTQFKDPNLTTFVCVCIPEFLSLYETERMIQELASFHIDTHAIVVNQLLFPDPSSTCAQCTARRAMQSKYLDQISDLYEGDFHIVKLPQLTNEVRGTDAILQFSEMLVQPYSP
ncbi:anion-transporting ATPase-like domain-containing protein [Lipomyces japonicus]|uniref:anion-transporting ATPase-like domain-containing protein n=1 Tax=Lipomyces japonicus TaxID=56871 RepID=UPI0034CD32E5